MSGPGWRDLTGQQLVLARSRRILLVEDDEHYVERVRAALLRGAARDQLALDVARSLQEALQLVHERTFDVIVLDLGLPDEFGTRTFERLRQAVPVTPIVVTTSSDDPDMAAYMLYTGAQDYLVKGASDDLLLHVLGRAISRVHPQAGALPAIEPLDDDASLQGRDATLFRSLVDQYVAIMDLAMRRRVLRDDGRRYRELLRTMSEQLGRADAKARDAMQIHAGAVQRAIEHRITDLDNWVAESRLVAIELLMLLTEHYRRRALHQGSG